MAISLPASAARAAGQLANTSASPPTAAHIEAHGVEIRRLRFMGVSLSSEPATVDISSCRHHRDGVAITSPSASNHATLRCSDQVGAERRGATSRVPPSPGPAITGEA